MPRAIQPVCYCRPGLSGTTAGKYKLSITDSTATGTRTGLVVASYGQRGILEADGAHVPYILKGRRLKTVCGDRVSWTAGPDGPVVTAVAPRDNALDRPDHRGKTETLAANLDQLAVVLAPEPTPDFFLADRFLCAGELAGTHTLLIWNKTDLNMPEPAALDEYRALGYPVIKVAALASGGCDALNAALHTGISILVGQSGVGKSALINGLVANADVLTGELSTGSGEGRHTTTASYMHATRAGGYLVDSPGVREFAPFIHDDRSVQSGFRDIVSRADRCRFADCQHTREPDCAVKQAVQAGELSERRYASYKRLLNMTAAVHEGRH